METVVSLRRTIESDPVLRRVLDAARSSMSADPGHDLGHALRVARWTLQLGGESLDFHSAVAASLLHDLVNPAKDSSDRSRASALSAAAARKLLAELGFEAEQVAEIAGAIRDHSFSRGAVPRTALGRALQDADRLEALGSLGWMRAVASGVRFGASFFDLDDPWAQNRELDDRRFTVDHFFVKLRRLPATMNTAEGRREAERRAGFLEQILRQLADEIGVEPPPEV